MSAPETLSEADEAAIRDLLVGRRIVAAEDGEFRTTGRYSWEETADGRLTLDDGTQILVLPNFGGCSCGAGDYSLTHLAAVDNIITSVRLADEYEPSEWEGGPRSYRIYVVADAVEVNVLTVDGDDGNGYYGTGYELVVIRPGDAA